MKKLTLFAVSLLLSTVAATALADKPTDKPDKPGKPPEKPVKVEIFHCGCSQDADDNAQLTWKILKVSSKSRGHQQHDAGDVEPCAGADDSELDLVRGYNDCQISPDSPLLRGLSLCTSTYVEGESCAEAVADTE